MEPLRQWLRRRGFALELRRGLACEVTFAPQKVKLDARLSREVLLLTALHECGHVAISLQRRRHRRRRVAGLTWREATAGCGRLAPRRSAAYLAYVQEEFLAWEHGERLARRLGLRYPRKGFERLRARCLTSYVRWAGRRLR